MSKVTEVKIMLPVFSTFKKMIEFFAQDYCFVWGLGVLFSVLFGGRVFVLYFTGKIGSGWERKYVIWP